MKTVMLASACLLAMGVAGCGGPASTPAPSKTAAADCPDVAPGQAYGPLGATPVADQIANSAPDGQPISLKLQYAAGLGACVDGKTGDIHLYGDKASGAQFTLTFASNLTGQATWPADATQAIQISNTQDGPFTSPPVNVWNPAPAVDGGGTILIFTVPYEKGHIYRYRLQYLDSTGALQTVEPMIINH